MSQPHVPPDPDPLHVVDDELERAAHDQEQWDLGYAAATDGQRWRVLGILLAAVSGAVIGAAAAVAAGVIGAAAAVAAGALL